MANERARSLRKNQTDAERILWRALKGKQLDGCRFRRQHPIGPYIADFICLERKLVIELDGGQHGLPERVKHDAERDAWLEGRDYHVARFWNDEIYTNLDGVLDTVLELLQTGHEY
ncbi:endonuclease domain-containing protein [Hyphococcus luteus]|uniref:DNA (Cytosine-5-)-methyltransferase n=1 Tax=Hyphococcus luteus TaxID=2058213 RepID=A0A2S7K9I6_9PROT|nr:endonuclease domain-containing protein [Marinicaulis flavus]PQA89143.1 DNA (cytosine-5-)-methyltransferase [Marinicaulis flavus]